ncbi:MAG TPA: gluconokinase [Gemmatimonadaceae bacterium]
MGVAGAGKTVIGSRLAAALGAEFVEGDSYHPPANIGKMAAGVPLNDEDRQGWLHAIGGRIRRANDTGEIVVVSCSALKRSYRDIIRSDAGRVRFIFLRGERELISSRMRGRKGHFMPPSLLDSQLSTLEEPSPDEDVWVVDINESPDEIVATLLARASA